MSIDSNPGVYEKPKYWEVRFQLAGGWLLVTRLIAEDLAEAGEKARASLQCHDIHIANIDRLCAECTELDMETGARK